MSYDLHVVRTPFWPDASNVPITQIEVDDLVRSDPELAWSSTDYMDFKDDLGNSRYFFITWRAESLFLWMKGQIICASPDENQIIKLLEIAERLNAFVIGNDDERYISERNLLGRHKFKIIRE